MAASAGVLALTPDFTPTLVSFEIPSPFQLLLLPARTLCPFLRL